MKHSTMPDGMREKLVETACEMIASNNGSSRINMRAIARKAGCAHTNIYSYFRSFDDLLYAAMLRTMETVVRFTQERVGTVAKTSEHFPAFILAQIDFAVDHPGLFRFLWLEILSGTIPDDVKSFAMQLKHKFAELVFNCSDGKLDRQAALEVSIILHSYLHGEVCKLISGREMELNFEKARDKILRNEVDLMRLLTDRLRG